MSSTARMHPGRTLRLLTALALSVAALLVIASPAAAITAAWSSSTDSITVTGAAGETNTITITRNSAATDQEIRIVDSTATASAESADAECDLIDPAPAPVEYACDEDPAGGGSDVDDIIVNLGDQNDTLTASAFSTDFLIANGETGDDTLTGSAMASPAGDTLSGGDGNDTVSGSAGDDTVGGNANNDTLYGGTSSAPTNTGDDDIDGGAGNDLMHGGDDSDEFTGGADIDRVLYSDHAAGVIVDISTGGNEDDDGNISDDDASDATPDTAEDDVHSDVELLTGSTSGDTLEGNCLANVLAGDPGPPNPLTTGGADTLNGDRSGCGTTDIAGDFMGGGAGADIFDGSVSATLPGSVADRVTYSANGSGQGISVSINDAADDNDGLGATTENIHTDIEYVFGGAGDDTINGSAKPGTVGVSLWGRLGNDTLTGSNQGDFLNGEDGVDILACGNGTDTGINGEVFVPPAPPPAGSCENQ